MVKGIIAIIASMILIKYRERVVDFSGKFEFAEKYLGTGGTYRFFLILAVVLFFWGVATMTGTIDVLLSPMRMVLGGGSQ